MKKAFKNFILAIVISFTGLAFAATPGIGEKVSEVTKDGYRFFEGFNFEDLPSEDHKESMEERVNSEIDYVIADDIENNNEDPYVIVGYSQGGLRVLAYATMLEKRINDTSLSAEERANAKENYQRLSGIITMSGIDRGLKALENNFDTFRIKVIEDGNIWMDGLAGVFKIIPDGDETFADIKNFIGISKAEDVVYRLKEWFPDFASSYIFAGWDSQPYSKIPEVYDMVPDSDFIKENVSKTTSITYKKQTGTRSYLKWEKVGWIYWWVKHTDPVYTTYTVYKDNPEFSKDIPIGYIVGTDSNTLGMTGDDNESRIRSGCRVTAKVMNLAQWLNHAVSYLTFITGASSAYYAAYHNCCTARDWFRNVDGELNELKGSEENDGLVAKESQFYPKRFYNPITQKYEDVHTKVLGKDSKGYVEVNKNHASINCDETFNDVIIPMIDEVRK